MNYRTVEIFALQDLGEKGTKIIDINVKDPITALYFYYYVSVGAAAPLKPAPDAFSKIELCDGSDVLMALSGTQLHALEFYEGHRFMEVIATNLKSTDVAGHFNAYFGRYLHDPELAFDPTKFRNPQLKVTFDADTVSADGDHVYLQVLAECFDEKLISPVGMLRNWEQLVYTPDASSYRYDDLPTDLVVRKLFLQTKGFGYPASSLLDEIKLSEDNDKRIPFDLEQVDLDSRAVRDFGDLTQEVWAFGTGNADPVWGAPCAYVSPKMISASAIAAIQCSEATGGKFGFLAAAGAHIYMGRLQGILPYYVHVYPFGDQKDMADWYDVTRVGSLRLRILGGAEADNATFHVILQQLRRY